MKRMVGSLALVGTVLLGPGAVPRASALEGRSFRAFAEATTINVQYGIPGFILTDKYVDHGGPTAQALIESAGGRRANAQIPYLGYMADYPGFPPLVARAVGLPDPPAFPAYGGRAYADDAAQPEQVVGAENGPYYLKAKVSDSDAGSIARFGPPGGDGASAPSSVARTDIVNGDDSVSVTAETVGQSFSLGPLSVTDMRAKSVTTYEKGATDPVTKSELFVKGVSAGSMAFSFGPDGLKVAQNGVPVPADQGLSSLNQALAPMGIEIHFASGRTLSGGAASAAFEVVQTHPVPGGGEGRQGIFRIRFGGVISQIRLGGGGSSS